MGLDVFVGGEEEEADQEEDSQESNAPAEQAKPTVKLVESHPGESLQGKGGRARAHQRAASAAGRLGHLQAAGTDTGRAAARAAAAGLDNADVVLVFGLQKRYTTVADAQLVATLLQLRRLATRRTKWAAWPQLRCRRLLAAHCSAGSSGRSAGGRAAARRPLHVLATIAASCTRELIATVAAPDSAGKRLLHVDLLAPDQLASGMLVQVRARARGAEALPRPSPPA